MRFMRDIVEEFMKSTKSISIDDLVNMKSAQSISIHDLVKHSTFEVYLLINCFNCSNIFYNLCIQFKDKKYSREDIDEVRDEWATCVLQHV